MYDTHRWVAGHGTRRCLAGRGNTVCLIKVQTVIDVPLVETGMSADQEVAYPQNFSSNVAAGILVERGSEVLLVETPRRGWEFPGGRIEEGETIVDGVLRELREEANIVASVDRLVGVYTNLSAGRVIFDFLGPWLSGQAGKGFETTKVAWVEKAGSMRMIEHPAYRRRLQQLLAFDGRVLFLSYTTPPFTVCHEQYV